jgi:hypothetical protein
VFAAELVGAARPAWMPHADPRVAALAGAYELLLTVADTDHVESRRAR